MDQQSSNPEEILLLADTEKEHHQPQTLKSRLRLSFLSTFSKKFTLDTRTIKFNTPPFPRFLNNETNYTDNNKYKWYTFLFLFLYYEFREFSNFYYLILCITQFFEPLQVGGLKRIQDQLYYACRRYSRI